MKAIVFDNAGTIIKRVTVLKEVSTGNLLYESNTIDLVNKNDDSLMLVFQTPTKQLIQQKGKIIDYLIKNENSFEISYSKKNYTKKDVIQALKNDSTQISDIKDSAIELIKKYDIDICSGSALLINIKEKKIIYAYTAGGLFFEDTMKVFKKLHQLNYNTYIASGDNKQSLLKIASILNIPEKNVFDTCNIDCKRNVVYKLQNKYEQVIMVGNNTNDYRALKQANIGILTIEQGEDLPDYLKKGSDFIIEKFNQILKIVEDEV